MWVIRILAGGFFELLRRGVRSYLGNAAFSVPFTFGALCGWALGRMALVHGLPYPWLPVAWALMMGAIFGEAFKRWWSSVFPGRRE